MKKTAAFCLCLVLALMICACAEIPPASSGSVEPSATPEPTPTEAVSATPEATPTPVPTKKPTATPTSEPTATPTKKPTVAAPQGGTPEYLSSYPFGSIDELEKFILTADEKTFEKGHYASMLDRVRGDGFFFAPKFTSEIEFQSVTGKTIALAVSELSYEAPGVGYRARYKNTDALIVVYNLSEEDRTLAAKNLSAYEQGKTKTSTTEANVKQSSIITGSQSKEICGRVYGERYRVWFLLDDSHLVFVEWFNSDAELAEEFVSKLEFEKVELKTGKPNLPTTPITPNA